MRSIDIECSIRFGQLEIQGNSSTATSWTFVVWQDDKMVLHVQNADQLLVSLVWNFEIKVLGCKMITIRNISNQLNGDHAEKKNMS